MTTRLAVSAIILALLVSAGSAAAQTEPQVVTVPLTRPGDPVRLEIDILSARIEVIGEDRDDAMFEIAVSPGQRRILTPSGPKTIEGGSFVFEIEEDDNVIELDSDWRAETVSVVARIPARADLQLETVNDGEIVVRNVTGNLELSNTNGPITASGISGSVIAESVNETIDVGFVRLDEANASAFESINGDLVVRLPADTSAELHLDTGGGEVSSEFEVELVPNQPSIEREDRANSVSIRVENVIVARINGGGPVLRMKTLHGDIQVRRAN